ncbi:MAG TPA: phosphohistidine phosphatase SixA [Spirochaetia bacterium]|nr:phosphohistidine phosphatase SixA [Spirochaetia bacterium]
MEVYFLRHGDAGAKDRWSGRDEERPLTPEGAARIEREAAALAAFALPVELIFTSPLVRARQTAEIAARRLSLRDVLKVDGRLKPGFGMDELASLLQDCRGTKALMLVGHEPDFSTIISACIGGGSVEVKKGGVARVDIESPASLRGVLVWLVPPRLLAADP